MLSLDLSNKNAFVTGVSDDGGFGWQIAKTLKAAGAKVWLASHPRTVSIVERILRRPASAEARKLPHGVEGEFQPDGLFGCDLNYDRLEDIPADVREQKGYAESDASIHGAFEKYRELSGGAPIDVVIHSAAFSPEIQRTHIDTSRGAYLTAMSVSSYSLIALTRAAMPFMEGRKGSVVGLTYLASTMVVPGYGGGMAAAKAALECDARVLSYFAGEKGHRVNLVSAGPYASRAARSIGDIGAMINHVAEHSPLKRALEVQEVADAVLFLAADFSSAVTGEVLHVDCGYHVMAA